MPSGQPEAATHPESASATTPAAATYAETTPIHSRRSPRENPIWSLTPDGTRESGWTEVDGHPTALVRAGGEGEGGAWPAIQPGVFDASGGFRSHRITVDFTLTDTVGAVLALDFSAERGQCPDLEIILDDHHAVVHPTVIRNDRSETGEPGPVAGLVHLRIPIPASWLSAGPHTLSITTVVDIASALGETAGADHTVCYEPGEVLPAARATYGNWFGSYIRWANASLIESVDTEHRVGVTLSPTPFYVHTEDGEAELIDCDLSWPAGSPAPDGVTIDWAGETITLPAVPAGRHFGMFRWRFPAPPGFDERTIVVVRRGNHEESVTLTPSRRWTLHVIPHVHLDLGFTDSQGKVLELHCRNIDQAVDRMAVDESFRFCVDGSMIVAEYVRTRTPERVQRMVAAVAAGQLGVNTFP